MRGAILEIRAASRGGRGPVAGAVSGHESVGLFGDRVHVVTLRPPDRTAAAGRGESLGRRRHAAAGVRRIEPSLEDVFVSVPGRSTRNGRPPR